MLKKIFAVYDEKSEAYLRPFFLDTVGQAERAIIDCLTDPNHDFSRHSKDYTLYLLGTFNDTNAEFKPEKTQIASLLEMKVAINQTSMEETE